MVVIAISTLMISGGVLSLNTYLATEKINSAATTLVSMLNLAKNFAQTKQLPNGYVGKLDYVAVQLGVAGRLRAYPVSLASGMNVGTSYFSVYIGNGAAISATMIPVGGLNFAAGNGRLVDSSNVPVTANHSVGITLLTPEYGSIRRQIIISPVGNISSFLN